MRTNYFQIVHKWIPFHKEPLHCSHLDKTIVLLQIGERFVPIVESAIKLVEQNTLDSSSHIPLEKSTSKQQQYYPNPENLGLDDDRRDQNISSEHE